MQRTDFAHFLTQPVRWGDMDALGHVNNVEFFRFFESGRIAYIDSLIPKNGNGDHGDSGDSLSASTVLADMRCSFLQQLHYPSDIDVATRIGRIGNSSMTLHCALFPSGQDAPAATAEAVLVWFDFSVQRALRVPQQMRDLIAAREVIAPQQQPQENRS